MTLEQLKELITELGYEDVPVFDNSIGFDYADAFIGMSDEGRAVYSYDKMVEHIMLKEGWTFEEAVEWIEYNTIRAIPYAGPNAPIVVYDVPEYMWPDEEDKKDLTKERVEWEQKTSEEEGTEPD